MSGIVFEVFFLNVPFCFLIVFTTIGTISHLSINNNNNKIYLSAWSKVWNVETTSGTFSSIIICTMLCVPIC